MPKNWAEAPVIYQIYPRSFADSNGDGSGDLRGIIAHLDHIEALGVDGIWLSPCFVSPQNDGGYDVADYRHIDPLYGSDEDMDELIRACHQRDIAVLLDIVPNHTSDQHRWFQEALKAGPGSAARERYHFRDADENSPLTPPNNWASIFGGPAWTRVCDRADAKELGLEEDGQFYLHLFDPSQPDLNWNHAEVRAEFEEVLDYWFSKGIDGFRIDVAHGLMKDDALPDIAKETEMLAAVDGSVQDPRWDQDGVHEIYRGWRGVCDMHARESGRDRHLVGELWVTSPERRYRYLNGQELDSAFAFDLLMADWDAASLRQIVAANVGPQVPPAQRLRAAWVLSNHDSVRHVCRFGLEPVNRRPNGIGPKDPQPNMEKGRVLARAATLLMLSLPGAAYLYQGEELGLPDHLALGDEERLDPTFLRTEKRELGRDGCRIPLPWSVDKPNYGFSEREVKTWLPQPESYRDYVAESQVGVAGSFFEFYREAIALRKELGLGGASIEFCDRQASDHLAFISRSEKATAMVICAIDTDVPIPQGWRVRLASRDCAEGMVERGVCAILEQEI